MQMTEQEVWGVKVTEYFEDGSEECLEETYFLRYYDAKAAAKESGGRVVRLEGFPPSPY